MDAQQARPAYSEESRERLEPRYGFIIYRTDYRDEAKWDRFISYLNAQVRAGLELAGQSNLIPLIDWKVQSVKSDLDEAGPEEVQELFNAWVESSEERDDGSARFMACIMADWSCVESVGVFLKNGRKEDEFDHLGISFVYLVSRKEEEGYTAIGMSYLMPRAFALIENLGWEDVAVPEAETALP